MRYRVCSGGVHLWQKRLVLSVIITIPVVYFALIRLFGNSIPLAEQLAPWSGITSFVQLDILCDLHHSDTLHLFSTNR